MISLRIFTFILLILCIQGKFTSAKILVTCDMDLPEEMHIHLPGECQNLTASQKTAAIEESKAYAQWHQQLDDYEKRKDPGFTDIPKKQWTLRENITRESMIWECQNSTTVDLYYKCLEDKHKVMISMLPKE